MRAAVTFIAISALTLAACGGAATGPISAELKDFSITLSSNSAAPGSVAFSVHNTGAVVHEFVVIDTDTAAGSLPVEGEGVSEEGMAVVDEIEDIAVGATESLTVDLAAGHYVIICNVAGHYAAGMHADLNVQ